MKLSNYKIGKFNLNKWTLIVTFFILFQFLFFSYYGFLRHYNYLSSLYDIGDLDQAIWGTLKGHPFLNTTIFNDKINRIGFHFDPLIVIFAPLYKIYPTVGWLIFAQSFFLSMALIPIFLLAKQLFLSDKISFIWTVIFSLNPFFLNAAAWDFHSIIMAVPFITTSFLAIACRNFKLLLVSSLFILLSMEHFGLMVFFFGLLWGLKHGEWVKAFSLSFLGIAVFILVFNFIMPYYSPTGKHIMFSPEQGQFSRYEWMGGSLSEIIARFFKQPWITLSTICSLQDSGNYFFLLFIPLLFFPVLGLEFLLPGVADLCANFLSANPLPRSIFSYHSASLIPVLTVASMYGAKRFCARWQHLKNFEVSTFIMASTLVFGWAFFPFFQLPGSKNVWNQKFSFSPKKDSKLQRVLDIVKEDLPASVQGNIGAHFSQRTQIFSFPNCVGTVEFVILHLESPTTKLGIFDPIRIGSLGHHLLMEPDRFLFHVSGLLENKSYGVVFWEDPWLVFKKNMPDLYPQKGVKRKLENLRSQWSSQITRTHGWEDF